MEPIKIYEFWKDDRVIQRLKLTQEQADSETIRLLPDRVDSYNYMPEWNPYLFRCNTTSHE